MLALREPDQPPAGQGTAFKIECAEALLDDEPLQRAFGVRLAVEVMLLERKPEVRGGDPLNRPTVYGGEGGSQRLVPGDEAIQRPLHGGAVEVALQSQPERDVIGLADALELRQEPQPLLRKR